MYLVFEPSYKSNKNVVYSLATSYVVTEVDSFADCLSTLCDTTISKKIITNSNLIIYDFKNRKELFAPCDYRSGLSVIDILVAGQKGEFYMSLRKLRHSETRYNACMSLLEQYIEEMAAELTDSEKDFFLEFGSNE